jgi:hypothetical protein
MRLFIFSFLGRIFSLMVQRVTQALLNMISRKMGYVAG